MNKSAKNVGMATNIIVIHDINKIDSAESNDNLIVGDKSPYCCSLPKIRSSIVAERQASSCLMYQ